MCLARTRPISDVLYIYIQNLYVHYLSCYCPHRFKRVQYINCGEAFLVSGPEGGRNIDRRIMPDGVHPNAAGMDVLGLCLDPTIAYLKDNPDAGEGEPYQDEMMDLTRVRSQSPIMKP